LEEAFISSCKSSFNQNTAINAAFCSSMHHAAAAINAEMLHAA